MERESGFGFEGEYLVWREVDIYSGARKREKHMLVLLHEAGPPAVLNDLTDEGLGFRVHDWGFRGSLPNGLELDETVPSITILDCRNRQARSLNRAEAHLQHFALSPQRQPSTASNPFRPRVPDCRGDLGFRRKDPFC
jgi:hypothetical protein